MTFAPRPVPARQQPQPRPVAQPRPAVPARFEWPAPDALGISLREPVEFPAPDAIGVAVE